MSISSALTNAASGLSASARAVQVVSSNVANALTEGYAARQIELTSSTLGGVGSGVRVAGVTRQVDTVLLGLNRDAGAQASASDAQVKFFQRLEAAIGLPGAGVSQALTAFETALIFGSERPDLDSRLSKIASGATALAAAIGAVEDSVQSLRVEADSAIAHDVKALNAGLSRIDALNASIVQLRAAGQSTLGLEDERQALVTTMSEIVPMREYPRGDGRLTLFSAGGQLLLDLDPQPFGFHGSAAIDATMTVGLGLSGLTVGGRAVDTGPNGPLSGGRLAANFAIRDSAAVTAQDGLDALAADLMIRFQDPATDPTLLPPNAGLFTDAGSALVGAPSAGLAGRIAINAAVDPGQGGDLWRIRDGIGAVAPGPVGAATQIRNLMDALDRPTAASPGSPMLSFSARLSESGTLISLSRQGAEDLFVQHSTRKDELTLQSLGKGVDSDAEMQRLLSIEQAYAANARVIETADAMLRRLLEI